MISSDIVRSRTTKATHLKERQQNNPMNITPADWMEQAEADLKAANDNITTKNYFVTANLSQQAAEKALKALYLKKRNGHLLRSTTLLTLQGHLGRQRTSSKPYLSDSSLPSIKIPRSGPRDTSTIFFLGKSKRLLTLAQEVVQWTKSRL